MDTLNFLLSPLMVKIYLAALFIYGLIKVAKEEKKDPRDKAQEPEDIEGHIAGIYDSETTDQAIEWYQKGNKYNALRSEAFLDKMAQLHQDAKGKVFS